jgi:hypothetical protein
LILENTIFKYVNLPSQYPSIILPFLDNFVSVSGVGIIDSMLEPYMKKETGAAQMDVGITYLFSGLFYMIGNPIAGWVSIK